eukprot:NODE_2860_length_980_cov_59.723329_g2840_i0.p1 GENE.NODE_2860_length_980_cov_59.723329_g2840_i0~~NODE_2860_length_980_cov_59.723329_g2840_i0.p1  ORF type:complete len:275 (+),score=31.13 NODE_2860_length_980_cov_59.723329_g2840_i0:120-944(+)
MNMDSLKGVVELAMEPLEVWWEWRKKAQPWTKFAPEISETLEEARAAGHEGAFFNIEACEFYADFELLVQFNTKEPLCQRKIRRIEVHRAGTSGEQRYLDLVSARFVTHCDEGAVLRLGYVALLGSRRRWEGSTEVLKFPTVSETQKIVHVESNSPPGSPVVLAAKPPVGFPTTIPTSWDETGKSVCCSFIIKGVDEFTRDLFVETDGMGQNAGKHNTEANLHIGPQGEVRLTFEVQGVQYSGILNTTDGVITGTVSHKIAKAPGTFSVALCAR